MIEGWQKFLLTNIEKAQVPEGCRFSVAIAHPSTDLQGFLKIPQGQLVIPLSTVNFPQVMQGGAFAVGAMLGEDPPEKGLAIDTESLLAKAQGLHPALLLIKLLTALHQVSRRIDPIHLGDRLGPHGSGQPSPNHPNNDGPLDQPDGPP
jgi:hypothetical protein